MIAELSVGSSLPTISNIVDLSTTTLFWATEYAQGQITPQHNIINSHSNQMLAVQNVSLQLQGSSSDIFTSQINLCTIFNEQICQSTDSAQAVISYGQLTAAVNQYANNGRPHLAQCSSRPEQLQQMLLHCHIHIGGRHRSTGRCTR